jgi:hypothetical protein
LLCACSTAERRAVRPLGLLGGSDVLRPQFVPTDADCGALLSTVSLSRHTAQLTICSVPRVPIQHVGCMPAIPRSRAAALHP